MLMPEQLIAIGAGMKIRPRDIGRIRIVDHLPGDIGPDILGMEMMRRADPAQGADGAAQIHVIARHQHAAAALAKGGYTGAILRRQIVSGVDREQPQFVIVGRAQRAEDRIIASQLCAIAGGDIEQTLARAVFQPGQMSMQQGKAGNGPIVLGGRDSGLQQDFRGFAHVCPFRSGCFSASRGMAAETKALSGK